VRVAKPDTGTTYFLSYRRRIGYDAGMRPSYADRTSIHTHGFGNTLLVAFLADGETFHDTANGITFTQLAHDAGSATIAVSMQCGNGVVDPGEECDGASIGGATCGGCAGVPACTSGCRLDYTPCSNGVCDGGETCASCAQDCVGTGAACGDSVCQAGNGESCVTCPTDCNGRQGGKPNGRFCCGSGGVNPVGCDPGLCGSCTTQPISVCCGDGVCNGDETFAICARDCQPCTDGDGDGYCTSQGDCNDANASIHPGATELCSGGQDGDCDGLIDCADPTCSTAPGCSVCRPSGESCSVNGECCSRSCKGRRCR
jgi:hypothetical protein